MWRYIRNVVVKFYQEESVIHTRALSGVYTFTLVCCVVNILVCLCVVLGQLASFKT